MEPETYTKEEINDAVRDQVEDKLDSQGYDFENNSQVENGYELAKDDIESSVIENSVSEGNLKEVEIDGDTHYQLEDKDKDLNEFAKEEVAQYDLNEVVDAGYAEKFDNADKFDSSDIKAFEDSHNASVSNSAENPSENSDVEIGDKLSSESSLNEDSKDTLMTREEGIETALENGADINELMEATSKDEVLEGLKGVSEDVGVEIANETKDPEVLDALKESSEPEVREAANDSERESFEAMAADKSDFIDEKINEINETVSDEKGVEALDTDKLDDIKTEFNESEDKVEESLKDYIKNDGELTDEMKEDIKAEISEKVETVQDEVIEATDSLVGNINDDQKIQLANESEDPLVLDELSNSNIDQVREDTAYNPNTSEETLDKLSTDESAEVRENVANHHNTSEETLDKLSSDENVDVREAVSNNSSTSEETLEKMEATQDEVKEMTPEEADSKIEADIEKFNQSKDEGMDNQEAMASTKETVDPVENQEEVKTDNQTEETSNNQATSVEDDSKGLGFETVEAEGNNMIDQMDNGFQEVIDQAYDKMAEAFDNKVESFFEGDKGGFDAEEAKEQVIKDNSVEVEGDHGVVKDDNMAGETERVVDKETAQDEMQKQGENPDKVETVDESDLSNAVLNAASQSSSDDLKESTEALDIAADKLDKALENSGEKEITKDDLMKEVSENAKDMGQENEEVKSANTKEETQERSQ